MKGHKYGKCNKCKKVHEHPKGMLGKKHSKETRTKYFNNRIAWNKGLTKKSDDRVKKYCEKINTIDRAKNISKSKKGIRRKPFSFIWKMNLSKSGIRLGKFKGESNPCWKGGVMNNKPFRISKYHGLRPFEWNILRGIILKRDGFICRKCDNYGKNIDHIITYELTKDNSLSNLQVLCSPCHAKKTLTEAKICVSPSM